MASSTQFLCTSIALVSLLAGGCQPEPQVETYQVPRESPPLQPIDPATVSQQLDHILVAIVPQAETAWFFKLVGKAPAIDRQRGPFEKFLSTVRAAESTTEPPAWDLPKGWQEKDAATAMRAATLVVPDESGNLELAVSSLPLQGEWEDFLVLNVDRWLGQLQRLELPRQTVLKLKREASTRDGKAALFELSGVMSQRPMGGGRFPTQSGKPAAENNATTESNPTSTNANKSLTYDAPEDWLPGKLSMMRKAAFLLPGGGPSDQVTVTSFPAAPGTQMDDVAANVQRWAGQVGLNSLDEDQLGELTEPVAIAGIDGTYVELESPAATKRPVALYAAMIKREGQVWFFKMMGLRELVRGQREPFREFLDSIEFP